MCRCKVEEEDVEAVGRATTECHYPSINKPLSFDQQAFMKAIGAATATIAHASATVATIAHASAMAGQEGVK